MNGEIEKEKFILARHWWALAIRGLLALIFGLIILFNPGIAVEVFIILFGIFALADGLCALIVGLSSAGKGHRPALIFQGLAGIAAGIIAFLWPGITILVLLLLIAVWALITGILEIIVAFQLPSGEKGKGLLGISGVLSIVIGLILFAHPITGIVVGIWIIGIYAIIAAVTLFSLSFMVRSAQKQV